LELSASKPSAGIRAAAGTWLGDVVAAWNRFWFTPSDPATLCAIRLLAGLMLLYTHLVWTLDLEAFFGTSSWVSQDAAWRAYGGPELQAGGQRSYVWSYLFWIHSPGVLWTVHIAGLVVLAMFALGLFSRVTAVLSYVIALAYVHRVPGALFGLDQINTMLAMYLIVGPTGAYYSLDAWIKRRSARRGEGGAGQGRAGESQSIVAPSVSANVAIRLMQLHLCVIYMFAGFGKLSGPSWWTGYGLWGGIANLEYQSLDVTWLAHWPLLTALLSHVTVYWEVFYCALIWPRMTRWIMLVIAVPMHLGIALVMGMATFGLVMLIANVAFVPPHVVRAFVSRIRGTVERRMK
jgi:hypothetical protein